MARKLACGVARRLGLLNVRCKDEAERLVVLPCSACLGRTPRTGCRLVDVAGGNDAYARAGYSS